jgi:hypothetical protein
MNLIYFGQNIRLLCPIYLVSSLGQIRTPYWFLKNCVGTYLAMLGTQKITKNYLNFAKTSHFEYKILSHRIRSDFGERCYTKDSRL